MGVFSKLFASNKSKQTIDLSVLKTDIHSHLIPGIDDGAQTIEDSIAMVKGLVGLGYQKLITTPHIMSDHYKNTPEIINNGLAILRDQVQKADINIKIEAAAEYYIDYDFELKYKNEKLLTFGDNYLLVEFSYMSPPRNLKEILFDLQVARYKPVLAHPERYTFWHDDFIRYSELKDKGILFQVNINSLNGYYSSGTKKVLEKLIKHEMCEFVGSDLHNVGQIDKLKQTLSNKYLEDLIQSGKLLNNTL